MIESQLISSIINIPSLVDNIKNIKNSTPKYKEDYNYKKYLDESIIQLINEGIPQLYSNNSKILILKKFNEIEWIPNKPFLKLGILMKISEEFWYIEFSYHNGYSFYYHSCIYDFLVNCINSIPISYNIISLQPEIHNILYFLNHLKTNLKLNYVLIDYANNQNAFYIKYLCKYNFNIYYILYDIKYNKHLLFNLYKY